MDNPDILVTLGTQDTASGLIQAKHNTENLKDGQHGPHQQPRVNRGAHEG